MQAQAAIEITPDLDGRLPSQLIQASYIASASALVILILNGVKASEVDVVLNEVVPLLPLTIPGVTYVDAADEVAVRRAMNSAKRIFVTTASLHQLAAHDLGQAAVVRPFSSVLSALEGLGVYEIRPTDMPGRSRLTPSQSGENSPALDKDVSWDCHSRSTTAWSPCASVRHRKLKQRAARASGKLP